MEKTSIFKKKCDIIHPSFPDEKIAGKSTNKKGKP
jgi:hypothetical protein